MLSSAQGRGLARHPRTASPDRETDPPSAATLDRALARPRIPAPASVDGLSFGARETGGLDSHRRLRDRTGMTSAPVPIRRRKLSDEVEERILALIRTERLKPGDVLPSERELMTLYGVGRPAIREAMQNLKRMGLADIRHGERPRVAEPSLEAMADQMSQTMRHLLSHSATTLEHLKEARVTFETEMARIAAERRRPGDLVRIREIIARQDAQRGDPPRFLQHDGEFHAALAAISGNPIFASLSQALFAWLGHFHIDLVQRVGLEQQTLTEHRAILDAVAEGDRDRAAQAMADLSLIHISEPTRLNSTSRMPSSA